VRVERKAVERHEQQVRNRGRQPVQLGTSYCVPHRAEASVQLDNCAVRKFIIRTAAQPPSRGTAGDESAHYEFICREAGVGVEYCAESFRNDGNLMSNIVKNLKRSAAGGYSRELSTKAFAGQCRS
jgi:hypothetical protein